MVVPTIDRLPRTLSLLQDGLRRGLHVGAQLHVTVDGAVVADQAIGLARPGVSMRPDTLMRWFSSTKPFVAVAIAQLWERGLLSLDDRLVDHCPEYAGAGRERISLRHLLTHTAGIPNADHPTELWAMRRPHDEVVRTLQDADLEWEPGSDAGYHPTSAWFLLGEVVRACTGTPLDHYLDEHVFAPLAITDSALTFAPDRVAELGDRMGIIHRTTGDRPEPLWEWETPHVLAISTPGAGAKGPIRDVARLYEAMLRGGEGANGQLLGSTTVEAMIARHRVGLHDRTLGAVIDWGLGVILQARTFGPRCSARAFGHGGAESSVCFADPAHGLVVAILCNGMCGAQANRDRMAALCQAVYEDLDLPVTAAGIGPTRRARAVSA